MARQEVIEVTGCLPGAVPPIASFPTQVTVVADETLPEVINFNCGLRTRSIQMTRKDYVARRRFCCYTGARSMFGGLWTHCSGRERASDFRKRSSPSPSWTSSSDKRACVGWACDG